MNKIILNADDFGLTNGVNKAIFELNKLGLVNSTTALVNSPYFKQGIEEAKAHPNLGVGIHLTIDLFQAEIYHPSLCDERMMFYKSKTHDLNRSLDSNVIYNEWKAQIEKFIAISGDKPTHIDSHHHAHIVNYDAKLAVIQLAAEYDLPVRELTTEKYSARCNGDFYNEKVCPNQLETSIQELLTTDTEYLEIMIHPAFVDDELLTISSYNMQRMIEFEAISSDQFNDYIKSNDIQISNYKRG